MTGDIIDDPKVSTTCLWRITYHCVWALYGLYRVARSKLMFSTYYWALRSAWGEFYVSIESWLSDWLS